MKTRNIVLLIAATGILAIICAVIFSTRYNKDYGSYIEATTTETVRRYDPSIASDIVSKVNSILPELAPDLVSVGITDFTVTEDNISYTANTKIVTVIWEMELDGTSYDQYLQITFNDDWSVGNYTLFDSAGLGDEEG